MDPQAQGTSLERLVDGAARQLGIKFDGYQVKFPLTVAGRRTVIDRVILMSGTRIMLIYIDGPQHDLRPDQQQVDAMQTNELEAMGYIVVHLHYKDLLDDPIGTVRRAIILRMQW